MDWRSGIQIPIGRSDMDFSKMSVTVLGPTHSPIKWVLGLFTGGRAAVASHCPLTSI